MTAGASAGSEARRSQQRIQEYQRLREVEEERLRRYSAASESECRIGALLAAMATWDWVLLPDRRWPGTKSANVDLIHVGPSGVYVIDVKAWAEPRVENGVLWRGQVDATDEVEKLLDITALVDAAAAEHGLAPVAVVPVIALAGRHAASAVLGRVHVVGEGALVAWLQRRPPRMGPDRVAPVAAHLARAFPGYDEPTPDAPPVLPLHVPRPRAVEPVGEPPTLFDVEDLEAALLENERAKPIEQWMTFLHPSQLRLVRRSWSGPARLRGPAGTGKTVIGLHRAAYLAATRPGQILVTSFVKTVPEVLKTLYAQLSPDTARRVEFSSLHRWAKGFLEQRGVPLLLDGKAAEAAFRAAWTGSSARPALERVADQHYWRDEVIAVIKGRGLTEFSAYADLRRVGRRTPLSTDLRRAVWDLYCEYEAALRARGVRDFADVLTCALAEVRREPCAPAYAAVIVDEVQDLTLTGLRLVHALAGDRPDALLLIGDGQQAIYSGATTAAEAGVPIAGRAAVLQTNYRNAREIFEFAAALVSADAFHDLDEDEEPAQRFVDAPRRGGRITDQEFVDADSLDEAMVAAIRTMSETQRLGDMAVLVEGKWQADEYRRLLTRRGIAAESLEHYRGQTSDAVKVGTFHRAKGLEFAAVYLPRFAQRVSLGRLEDQQAAARRSQFVAMTRARDSLWVGRVAAEDTSARAG